MKNQPPELYFLLKSRGLLSVENDRFDTECLWLEGVRWLTELGPAIKVGRKRIMVPFAISAYGDWWCFGFSGEEVLDSIILSPPDTGDCTFYAPSFEGFLFRRIMRLLSNDVFTDETDPDGIRFTVHEMHEQINIWINQIGSALPDAWSDLLSRTLREQELKTHVHSARLKYQCLVLPAQERQLVQDLLRYPKLDEKFKFDRLKVEWYGE